MSLQLCPWFHQSRKADPGAFQRFISGTFLHSFQLALLFALSSGLLPAQTPTPVPVPTWRYDLTHAGQNTQETALTPTNVNVTSFGKLFSVSVDSTVYAQPLYVPGLTMSDGLVHNVLFVATENDSIYAFDADSNQGADAKPLWQISLLTSAYGAGSGATAIPWQDTGSPDVAPTVGITGTPAINPATNTMYVVANTKESGVYYSRLHAINIITGAEQSGSPVNITATVAGNGAGSSGGKITFDPLIENQRPALDYYNGYVYFGYSAHGDNGNWHGWLFAYNATTLQQTAVLCLTPNDIGGGIWSSGAGMPIDTSVSGGRMFVVTGNGARSSAPPFSSSTDYGESVVAFDIANGQFTPTDEFTPFNYATLNSHDYDQASGGLLMLPDQQGAYPHLLITAGKEGRITLLNRDNLGGYASGASSNTNAVQDIPPVVQVGQGFWSTAAYWNGNVYLWAGGELPSDGGVPNVGMQFKINSGLLTTAPSSKTSVTSAYPGPSFSISSNGTQDGVAWAVRADQFNTNGPAVLYAFDANDLSKILYESDTNASRDKAGPANKFSVPVVTNGKVYIATNGQVDVYGLLNGESAAAAPVITPNGGTFSTSQSVTMSSATSSASIYYTLNGTTPTTASAQYTGPITISSNTTVKAIAAASGYLQSSVSSATFTFGSTQCAAPSSNGINVCSPAEGASVTSPVSILAAATVSGGVYRFELWNGNTKLLSESSGTMNQSLAMAAGSYKLTFSAYNSAGTHVYATRDITVSGTSSGSFSLSGSSFVIGWRGGSIHVPITVSPSSGFTGSVALACSVSGPSGAVSVPACTVSTQPPSITGTSSVKGYVYVTTQTTTSLGNYTLNVNGNSGSLSNSTSISFTVN
ncbi:MAG TPA: chitobiase/beta-hexosaminidase C-terminal domain-containing protein [Terracidiphilus sp.]|nr:chitobiase/beta-hexosaminidase C-terminal domain-containing protein [Terracidiphilus sp.]